LFVFLGIENFVHTLVDGSCRRTGLIEPID